MKEALYKFASFKRSETLDTRCVLLAHDLSLLLWQPGPEMTVVKNGTVLNKASCLRYTFAVRSKYLLFICFKYS